jgi:hypothetical protein
VRDRWRQDYRKLERLWRPEVSARALALTALVLPLSWCSEQALLVWARSAERRWGPPAQSRPLAWLAALLAPQRVDSPVPRCCFA